MTDSVCRFSLAPSHLETVITALITPSVAILLPVYNGAAFLGAQLDSLIAQTHDDWHLFIGDDGSTDQSRALLRSFGAANPTRSRLFDGPQSGIPANVWSLLGHVDPATQFVAFCDQDDVWHDDKLARACAALRETDTPAMYCSRTNLIDAKGRFLRVSPKRSRPPTFRNALAQNVASGNTFVLNQTAWHLLREQSPAAHQIAYHDWWTYQLISGAGGRVVHDDTPSVDYRQHDANVVGAATGLRGARRRIRRVFAGSLLTDTSSQIAALQLCRDVLSPDNVAVLDRVFDQRGKGPWGRLIGVLRAGLYRQSRVSTLGLWVSAFSGRF